MSSKNWMAHCGIKLRLRPFKALRISLILQIEVDTDNGDILADEMGYRKVRYQIFWELVANIISRYNV